MSRCAVEQFGAYRANTSTKLRRVERRLFTRHPTLGTRKFPMRAMIELVGQAIEALRSWSSWSRSCMGRCVTSCRGEAARGEGLRVSS